MAQIDFPADRHLEVGTVMENINILKDANEVIVGRDEEYPSWIWDELEIPRKGGNYLNTSTPPLEKTYWRRPVSGLKGGSNEERLLMVKDPSIEWSREAIRSCNKDRIKYNNSLKAKK